MRRWLGFTASYRGQGLLIHPDRDGSLLWAEPPRHGIGRIGIEAYGNDALTHLRRHRRLGRANHTKGDADGNQGGQPNALAPTGLAVQSGFHVWPCILIMVITNAAAMNSNRITARPLPVHFTQRHQTQASTKRSPSITANKANR